MVEVTAGIPDASMTRMSIGVHLPTTNGRELVC